MNEKRKGARRWTALALSVAMVFSGIGILPAPVKAEAADVAGSRSENRRENRTQ